MTDAEFEAKVRLLKRLGWLALVGVTLLAIAFSLGDDQLDPYRALAVVGGLSLVPGLVYLVLLTIWHWKGRYRGVHSNLWGALLVIETSGWFKVIYLFRHIIPDARRSGRYAATVPTSEA
jgi:hypothetical protein